MAAIFKDRTYFTIAKFICKFAIVAAVKDGEIGTFSVFDRTDGITKADRMGGIDGPTVQCF